MIISVTQDDIDNGFPGECRACPIYHATLRAGFEDPIISNEYVTEFHHNHLLPKAAQDFIDKFDRKEKVHPFQFEIEGK